MESCTSVMFSRILCGENFNNQKGVTRSFTLLPFCGITKGSRSDNYNYLPIVDEVRNWSCVIASRLKYHLMNNVRISMGSSTRRRRGHGIEDLGRILIFS